MVIAKWYWDLQSSRETFVLHGFIIEVSKPQKTIHLNYVCIQKQKHKSNFPHVRKYIYYVWYCQASSNLVELEIVKLLAIYNTRELFIDLTGSFLLLLHDFAVRQGEEIFEGKEVIIFQKVPTNSSCVIQRHNIFMNVSRLQTHTRHVYQQY